MRNLLIMEHRIEAATYYGPSGELDCLLMVPHGDRGDEFLEAYPEFEANDISATSPALLRRYLRLEQDVGSKEIAFKIKEVIGDLCRVGILTLNYPRGILDGNRVPNRAIRNFFLWHKSPELEKELLELHDDAWEVVKATVARLTGVLIDVHTMSHHEPKTKLLECPENLLPYVRSYLDERDYGPDRPFDLITATRRGSEVADIGDEFLTRELQVRLMQEGLPVGFNNPYYAEPHLRTTELLERTSRRGVGLDIPKRTVLAGDHFGIRNPAISPSGLIKVAGPIGNAVIERLRAGM